MRYRLSRHAREELKRRDISLYQVEEVLTNPGQVIEEHGNRRAYQSQLDFGEGKLFLLRVIVFEEDPVVVITVYRTSKSEKYWRE